MSTLAGASQPAYAMAAPVVAGLDALRRRQPELAAMSLLCLIAVVPCLLAMQIDTRTVNEISVWIKPAKFLLSLTVYYATLAWFFAYLPAQAQRGFTGLVIIRMPIAIGALEMSWLIAASGHGVPSHFNDSAPLWEMAYAAAGLGALLLLLAVLVQGAMLARQRAIPVAPAFRHGLVLGCLVACVATTLVAGHLAGHGGHWVGGVASDAGGLPLFGWSRTGGDLRVAHFWALHAHQLLPLAGWLIAQAAPRRGMPLVWLVGAGYTGLIAFTFRQALEGRPFIG